MRSTKHIKKKRNLGETDHTSRKEPIGKLGSIGKSEAESGFGGIGIPGTIGRTITGIAGITVFSAILYFVITGSAAGFDDPVRELFYSLRNDVLTAVATIVTHLGNWRAITVLCIILLIIKSTRITYGIPVSVGAAFVTILNKSIKMLVQRPRPDDVLHLVQEGGFSFSSGHSVTSMFVYGMLIYLVRTNIQNKTTANILTVVLAIPMICIGLSRIYLGVHYPTDVLAGWCLGITVIMVMVEAITRSGRNLK